MAFLSSVLVNGLIDLYFIFFLMAREESHVMLNGLRLALMLALGYGVLTVTILSFAVYGALKNITLNEMINRRRYAYLKNSSGLFQNQLDRGLVANLGRFFHFIPPLTERDTCFYTTQHIFQAATNITTNERINRKRYAYLKDGKGSFYNPFDRGLKLNLLEFLHLRPAQTEDDVQLLGIHTV
ncbi:palmitoyltransferase [Plakobranchus ocellatus]|uniref:Palmitoyltransferase n=1 Tax=Plakobranchus ocellatus TaxID=259542 RepID=A0AAV4AQX2_9GAST|nr:palmitoyltransferase [Plakobranchus ocellatus]